MHDLVDLNRGLSNANIHPRTCKQPNKDVAPARGSPISELARMRLSSLDAVSVGVSTANDQRVIRAGRQVEGNSPPSVFHYHIN